MINDNVGLSPTRCMAHPRAGKMGSGFDVQIGHGSVQIGTDTRHDCCLDAARIRWRERLFNKAQVTQAQPPPGITRSGAAAQPIADGDVRNRHMAEVGSALA